MYDMKNLITDDAPYFERRAIPQPELTRRVELLIKANGRGVWLNGKPASMCGAILTRAKVHNETGVMYIGWRAVETMLQERHSAKPLPLILYTPLFIDGQIICI